MPQVTRQKATPEEIAEARGDRPVPVVRQKATPDEIAEAQGVPSLPEQPSTASALGHGAVQGGTLGFGDEWQGLVSAVLDNAPLYRHLLGYPSAQERGEENIFSPTGYGYDFGETYRRGRDAARAEDDAAKAAHPIAYGASEVGGTLAVPFPGAGGLKGGARAVAYGAQGAALGGASALGHSKADLTTGDPAAADAATRDIEGGAAIGAPAAMVGGAISDKLGSLAAGARASRAAANDKALEAAFNSARGALGGETSSAARTLEVLEKAASDPSLPEDVSRQAAELLAGPDGAALKAQVVRSSLGRFPDQLGRIQSARDAMTDAAAKWTPEEVQRLTESDLAPSAALKAIGSRLKTLGERYAPVAVGGALGGPGGAAAGALVGGMAGRPTTIVGNMMKAAPVVYNAARVGEPLVRGATKAGIEYAGATEPWASFLRDEEEQPK